MVWAQCCALTYQSDVPAARSGATQKKVGERCRRDQGAPPNLSHFKAPFRDQGVDHGASQTRGFSCFIDAVCEFLIGHVVCSFDCEQPRSPTHGTGQRI